MKSISTLALAAMLTGSLLFSQNLRADAVIGSFPQMDGGLETQSAGNVPTQSSIATGVQYTTWTANNASGTGAIAASGGRSGSAFVTNYSATASRRLQSPTVASGAMTASTDYLIQYYYRSVAVANAGQIGFSGDGTGSPGTYVNVSLPSTSGVWTKVTATGKTGSSAGAGKYGIAILRFSAASAGAIDVDDICVYAGTTADTTAPDPATAPVVDGAAATSLNVSWTAPGTGVDGGGYLVVRGTSDPTTAPNVNGIYKVGSAIGSGTVAYVGTGTSFTDSGINSSTTYYYRIYAVDKAFNYSTAISGSGSTSASANPPVISGITPSSYSTNAGGSASFTVSLSSGDAPLTYYWYKETALATNLIPTATTATLSLTNVTGADTAGYQVVVSNAILPMATSSVVTLTVTDPYISTQPANQTGLLNGQAQFTVSAGGSSLAYQWYFCASPSDNQQLTAPVANGALASGSIASGATTTTLGISNLQSADPTNFVLVVSGTYGAVTSSVASLALGSSGVSLAYWTFNGDLNEASPVPYQGVGTAAGASTVSFIQVAGSDNDWASPGPNHAWGTKGYPLQGTSNKVNGARFNTSTVGAKNVNVTFDLRATTTASKYFRLQYTTNGTDFIDYPVSTPVISATLYNQYPAYNLSGFAGVRNNPNFGIKVVTEFESTAKNGNTNNANYVGVSSTYNGNIDTGGTISFDIVNITADAITSGNTPPVIGTLTNLTFADTFGGTEHFIISDDTTDAGTLSVSAVSLDPAVSLGFTYNNVSGNFDLGVNATLGNVVNVNVPVKITVTDGDGESTVAWFMATITPGNAAPVLTGLSNTNLLTNSVLVIPFTVVDDHTVASSLTVTASAPYNTAVVPNDGAHLALALSGAGGTNRTLTITPIAGQSGTVPVTVTADDGTLTNTLTFFVTVRPNASVVLVDNFTYDAAGGLTTNSGNFWVHHGGNTNGELQVAGGQIIVDNVHHAEDINAPLIGAPYLTNSAAVLYARFNINYTTLPDATGNYFAHFKDDTTFGFFGRVWASSNSPTTYRIGIGNTSGASASSPKVAKDLSLNTSYTIIARMVVSSGVCTIWVNPASESDTGATDSAVVTNLTYVTSYAIRDGNTSGGILNVSNLAVGTTFNSVLYVEPADVSLTQTGPASVLAAGSVTYTLTVSNAGPFTANGVVVTDTLPASTSFVSASGGGVNSGGVVSWAVGTLASGASASVTVTATAPASGSLTNAASASSVSVDSNPANNTSTPVVTSVIPATIVLTGFQAVGNDFVLQWDNGSTYLQSSTNVAGPYDYVLGATSPYTNDVSAAPQMFFRLTTQAP